MEEISSTIAMAYLGNMIYDESMIANCVDINGLEVVTNTRRFSEHDKNRRSVVFGDRTYSCSIPRGEVSSVDVAKDDGDAYVLTMVSNRGNFRGLSDERNYKTRNGDSSLNSSENNIGAIQSIRRSFSWDLNFKPEVMEDLVSVVGNEITGSEKSRENLTTPLVEVPQKLKIFCLDITPRWGFTSICGRRNEMEDAVVALPGFLEVPAQMVIDVPITRAMRKTYTGNLFGVYDGHGGIQVANYCRDRLHLALEDEMNILKNNLNNENGNIKCDLKEYWEKTFLNCFQKVDDEIGGFYRGDQSVASASGASLPPIAPEAVGSTAVVAIVLPTHIIVANCGDSRAVLNRGKVPMPLSIDHKPNREDEYERIEAAGGKVINWDGYRVSGVLAVSRSIGDRYLRPYVIPDPEVTVLPRTKEDDCLILASDGLWDVLTNEEVCDVARRRILLWHKKNGVTASAGEAVDPAAQDAADYLSRLALQRGSKDNISVIVVDLKAQRKFKTKS